MSLSDQPISIILLQSQSPKVIKVRQCDCEYKFPLREKSLVEREGMCPFIPNFTCENTFLGDCSLI